MSAGSWEWQDEHGNWKIYDSPTQTIIAGSQNGQATIHAPNGHAYLVDLNGKFQENVRYKTRRPIRFVASGGSGFLSGISGFSKPKAPKCKDWACDKCTFINSATELNCGVCGIGVNPKSTEILKAQFGGDSPSPSPSPPPHPKRKRHKKKQPVAPPAPPAGGGWFGGFGGGLPSLGRSGFGGGVRRHDEEEEVEPSGPRFVDPKELARKKAKEEKARIKKEKKDGNRKCRQLLVLLKKNLTESECWSLLKELYKQAPEPTTDIPEQTEDFDLCQVCFADEPDAQMITCSHRNCCTDCLLQHMKVKIKDDDIIPWICCPYPDCRAKIHPDHFKKLDANQVVAFCRIQLYKALQRNSMWVDCKKESCHYGFLIEDDEKHRLKCEACGKKQSVSRSVDQDDSIKEMLKQGVIRKCPKCNELTMKDKGICNILNCGKCGVWWNWKTRKTGNSQREMKQAARMNGTLWEPGELAFQQQLQRSNPAEFKKMLERNGIEYDPNYVRGR